MKYIVMDFGGMLVKYSVLDESCTLFERGESDAPVQSKEAFLGFIKNTYETYSKGYEIGGIAISMPGVINDKTGDILSAGAYMKLYGINLYEELKPIIPVPVTVENDGKCGALAEVWQGNLKDVNDGIVLILGTGVAGGIIKDRKIHKGQAMSAGEFSYMLVGQEKDIRATVLYQCSVSTLLFKACVKKGIDVRKGSAREIVPFIPDFSQELTEWNERPEYKNGMDGYQFFELLENGDAEIAEIYDEFLSQLARLIINLQFIYSPEKVLIGGGVSRQPRLVSDINAKCEELIDQTYMGAVKNPCNVQKCLLGNEANQYGALYSFLKKKIMEEI